MEREETEEKEAVRKTEKERHEMKYKAGDKVRVRSDLKTSVLYGSLYVVAEMIKKKILTIASVHDGCYKVVEDDYEWTDEMFEGLAEDELAAEEAIKIQAEMCSMPCRKCPIGKEKGVDDCITFRAEHPDKVLEILKQRKKEREKKEVEVESKLYLNDEIKEILAKYCSEHVGDYFAVCENRWMVKQ